jgi:hypothetical protein
VEVEVEAEALATTAKATITTPRKSLTSSTLYFDSLLFLICCIELAQWHLIDATFIFHGV